MAYNKIKNNLRQEAPLPEGFGFDDLQEGIYARMPKEEKKKRRFFIFWWLIPMCVLSLGAVYIFQQSSAVTKTNPVVLPPSAHMDHSKTAVATSQKPSDDILKSETSTSLDKNERSDKMTAQSKNNASNAANNLSKDLTLGFQEMNRSTQNKADLTKETKVKHVLNSDAEMTSLALPSDRMATLSDEKQTGSQPALLDHEPSINDYTHQQAFLLLDKLPLITMQSLTFDHSKISISGPETIIPLKKSAAVQWELAGGGGFLTWQAQNTFPSDILQPNHNGKTQLATNHGYHIFLQTDVLWNNGFYLSSGLDYQKRYSAISYEGLLVTNTLEPDQIIKIEKNLLTGMESVTRGSSSVKTTTERKFRKNNVDHIISLPIIAGYQIAYRNWSFQCGAGLSVNLFSHHTGTTIAQNEVAEYNGKHPLWQAVWDLNLESQAKVKYYFGQNMYVGTQFRFSRALQNQLLTDVTVWRPYQITIGGMIGYQF